MGKTRDLFKKIRDTKGAFHAKMDTLKDRNCMEGHREKEVRKKLIGFIDMILTWV